MSSPFLSIIIPSFNQGRFIGRTIRSVLSQNCDDYEVIVMDAGSRDETAGELAQFGGALKEVCVEKDEGQADAINKGIKRSSGRLVTWLNSDDLLLPETVRKLRDVAREAPRQEWFMGDTVWIDTEDRILACGRGNRAMPWAGHLYPAWGVPCPSAFVSRELWDRVGGLDKSLHYNFDIDLWLKLISNRQRYVRLRHYCWGFRLHEQSKTSGQTATRAGGGGESAIPARRLEERLIVSARYGFSNQSVWMRLANWSVLAQRITDGSLLRGRLDSARFKGRSVHGASELFSV